MLNDLSLLCHGAGLDLGSKQQILVVTAGKSGSWVQVEVDPGSLVQAAHTTCQPSLQTDDPGQAITSRPDPSKQ